MRFCFLLSVVAIIYDSQYFNFTTEEEMAHIISHSFGVVMFGATILFPLWQLTSLHEKTHSIITSIYGTTKLCLSEKTQLIQCVGYFQLYFSVCGVEITRQRIAGVIASFGVPLAVFCFKTIVQ